MFHFNEQLIIIFISLWLDKLIKRIAVSHDFYKKQLKTHIEIPFPFHYKVLMTPWDINI